MFGFFRSLVLPALAAQRVALASRRVQRRSSKHRSPPLAAQQLERRDLMAKFTWAVEDGGNGHEYEFINQTANFFEARAIANSQGGHLVTLQSPAETFRTGSGRWIGAFGGPVVFPDDHWEWVTGEPMEYTPWASGEPNDYFANGEYAVESWGRFSANDKTPESRLLGFIIEYDGLRDQGLDDGPHAPNDAVSLATDLGSISGLTTVDASLRKVGDIDWYSFQTQKTGDLQIRVPVNPYVSSDFFGWSGEKAYPSLRSPEFYEFKFAVQAGRTYTFATGNFLVAEELPYQLTIAPPGTSLPAAPAIRPEASSGLTNVEGSVNTGESKYYPLTALRRADIAASLAFDRSAGDLKLELVNPRGQVLATGVASDEGVRLEHGYFHDRTLGGQQKFPFSWAIYLRVTGIGGPVHYVLNASVKAITNSDPRLALDLGPVALGAEKIVELQYPRLLEFQAPTTGSLQVLASGLVTSVLVRDQSGAIVADSMKSILVQPAIRGSRAIEFIAQQGTTYYLEVADRPATKCCYIPHQTRFLFLPGEESLQESEPNNTFETADKWGPVSHWVINATADPSENDNSRTDVFELIAGETGRLFTGAGGSTDPNSSMEVFVNSVLAASEFVHQGDVIRYEVKHFSDRAPYMIAGRIVPVRPEDDMFEYDERNGHPTLWVDTNDRYKPLLHSASDVDYFEAKTTPGVYIATVETPEPEKYSMRVIDVRTGHVVATGAPADEEVTATFVSYGGRYQMQISAAGESFSLERYRPSIAAAQQPLALIQTPTRAEMNYFVDTNEVGEFTVNFVGEIEVSFVSASSGGAPFGAAHVGIVSSQGDRVEQEITDGSAPIRMAVRPGKYFLGIETETRQSITAKVQFVRTPGDANGDGRVDLLDFALLRASFGQNVPPFEQGDFNGDGVVDINDFAILRINFNRRD